MAKKFSQWLLETAPWNGSRERAQALAQDLKKELKPRPYTLNNKTHLADKDLHRAIDVLMPPGTVKPRVLIKGGPGYMDYRSGTEGKYYTNEHAIEIQVWPFWGPYATR